MKKYLWMICLVVLCAVANTALAAEATAGAQTANTAGQIPAPERFQVIAATERTNVTLDTQTIRYVQDPYREEKLVDAWVKTIDRDTGGYNLSRYYFRTSERQAQLITSMDFDSDGNVLATERNSYAVKGFKDVIPETPEEKSYNAALQYAKEKLTVKKSWPF